MLRLNGNEAWARAAKFARALVSMILVGCMLLPGPVARADTTEPIAYDSVSPVPLSTTKAVPVTVLNNSAQAYAMGVEASLTTGDGAATTTPMPITVAPPKLAPAGSAEISVGPVPEGTAKGKGWLVVTATPNTTSPAVVIRRALTFGTTNAKPLVSSWNGTRILVTPWGLSGSSEAPLLPLDQEKCDGVSPGTAYVEDGTTITSILYSCRERNGRANLALDLGNMTVGSFSGKLALGDANVDLKVRGTVTWFWPVLVIVVGLLVVVAQQAWTANLRPIRRARSRADDIAMAAKAAQKEFADNAPTAETRRYDFVVGVAAQASDVRERLAALRPAWARRWFLWWFPTTKTVDDDNYTAAIKDMAGLEATVRDWPGLGTDLAKLKSKLASLNEDLLARAGHLADSAELLLEPVATTGEATVSLDRARELILLVPKTTTALGLLPIAADVDKRIRDVTADGGALAALPMSDRRVLNAARHAYQHAAAELAEAPNAHAVELAKVDQLLAEARGLILQVTGSGVEPPGTAAGLQAISDGSPFAGILGFFSHARRAIASLFTGRAGVRAVDGAWLLVALAVVVWSGLSAKYVDQAWGTGADFVSLFVWVVGGTAVLTQVLSGLENLVAGPLRIKDGGASGDEATTTVTAEA